MPFVANPRLSFGYVCGLCLGLLSTSSNSLWPWAANHYKARAMSATSKRLVKPKRHTPHSAPSSRSNRLKSKQHFWKQ